MPIQMSLYVRLDVEKAVLAYDVGTAATLLPSTGLLVDREKAESKPVRKTNQALGQSTVGAASLQRNLDINSR